MKYVCQYAIVRFLPFVETGEFANVGTVLFCPDKRFFGFKLNNRRPGRITKFFHQIDANVYRNSIHYMNEELDRIHLLMKYEGALDGRRKNADISISLRIFEELTRPRESLLRFDSVRVALAENPKNKLNELYNYYIERDFVSKENKQRQLENKVRNTLHQHQLISLFEERKVGDENYNHNFPFVHSTSSNEVSLIKPLSFDQSEPSDLIEQGLRWGNRIKKLADKGFILPENALFAVQAPNRSKGNVFIDNYHEAVDDLKAIGVQVTDASNDDQIATFAQSKI